MCDLQCTAGIGITAGVVGVMMTIICCKALLSLLVEQMTPEAVVHTTPQIQMQRLRQTQQQNHSVVEMPIVLRIYLPQVQGAAARFQVEQPITKNAFEPLPV
jgi:hypothetical protein